MIPINTKTLVENTYFVRNRRVRPFVLSNGFRTERQGQARSQRRGGWVDQILFKCTVVQGPVLPPLYLKSNYLVIAWSTLEKARIPPRRIGGATQACNVKT